MIMILDLMAFLPSSPDASLMEVFQTYPELSQPLHEFANLLMRGDSPFTAGERELIAAFVSVKNGCAFCRDSHGGVAEKMGYYEAIAAAFNSEIDSEKIAPKMKPVLRYVEKLTLTPNQVHQEDVKEILAAGWDEKAVVHANLVCAFFNLMNRWVEGLGIDSNPKITSQTAHHLYQKGYQQLILKSVRR